MRNGDGSDDNERARADRRSLTEARQQLADSQAALAASKARLEASTQALAESVELGAFLESILNASNDCIKVLSPEGQLVFMNSGGHAVMEVDDFDQIRGCPWIGFWDGPDKAAAEAALEHARGGGTGRFAGYCKTAKGTEKYWDVTVTQVPSTENRVAHFLSISRDITAERELELQRELLSRESAHRVKNILTVVQSIAQQTLGSTDATDDFAARLQSLAKAHDVLVTENWDAISLREIVETALLPVCSDARCGFEGEDVDLSPDQGLALALALHELATNAIKYGALSNDGGKVLIRSTVDGERLTISWMETGGPRVTAPGSDGFGTRVMTRNLEAHFKGKVTRRFEEDGLRFELVADLK